MCRNSYTQDLIINVPPILVPTLSPGYFFFSLQLMLDWHIVMNGQASHMSLCLAIIFFLLIDDRYQCARVTKAFYFLAKSLVCANNI